MEATRLLVSVLCIFVLAGCGKNDTAKIKSTSYYGQECSSQAKPDTFLVEWKDVPKEYEKQVLHPGSKITRFNKVDKDLLEKTLQQSGANVVNAEHEFVLTIQTDGLTKDGSTCNATVLPNAWGPTDMKAPEAWNLLGEKGDGVIVAVVDSGVDIYHNLLSSQIWTNTGEILGNGIDDDGNGYIDDYKGLSFYSDFLGQTHYSSDVSDESNHGTHVAGIIAGQAGSLNFTGVAPKAKIMPLKFIDGSGEGSVGDAIAAMEYAIKNGARVINASWGGSLCSDLLKQEIQKVVQHGTVFVNAAGNSGKDISNPNYMEWPAVFQIPGKITIGAMNQAQLLSSFSNFGTLVDIAAPGETILSTVPPDPGMPHNTLCTKSGTSMATPFVSGLAALLVAAKPTASAIEIVNAINQSSTPGHYGVRTGGKINAYQAGVYLQSH